MKKRAKLILMALVGAIVFGCAGCSSGINENVIKEYNISPNITVYSDHDMLFHFHYAVDNNTNVVYIIYIGSYQAGITAMLNPDGTPVLADQIGLK